MSLIADLKSLEPSQRSAIWASYLGWTLDAFDYFLLVFMLKAIADRIRHRRQGGDRRDHPDARRAADRRVRVRLARRAFRPPPGADGRHHPLLAVRVRLRLRAVADQPARPPLPVRDRDGRRMGARRQPGDGDRSRRKLRGPVSGLLQSGYPSGYFVASLVYFLLFDTIGWRGMFMVGVAPACSSCSSASTSRKARCSRRGAASRQRQPDRRARPPLEDRALHDRADGRVQRLQPRHPGPLSDLPPEAAPLRHPPHRHARPRS